jgi:hypothetical protein
MVELTHDEVDTSEGATVNDRRYAAKLIELAAPLVGTDHDRKVFLADLMRAAHAPSPRVFLRNLVRLNRLGLIRLSRCDLPMAYNLEKVGKSEVTHAGSSFHFLDVA